MSTAAPGLRGIQKAAAIMLTLNEEDGARVLSHMDEDEIRQLSLAMADIGNVSSDAMENVMSEFDEQVASFSSIAGSLDKTEALLGRALPSAQVKAIMDEIRKPSRGVWKKLSAIDRGLFTGYLKGEHPQTIAVILTQVEPDVSSRVISSFPQALAVNVINRMLKLQPVQKEVLEQLEKSLEQDLLSTFSIKKKVDTHVAMAEVFNSFDKSSETRLMEALEQLNGPSSKRIRQLMFTFEDLMRLDAAAMQTVIRVADKSVIAKALFGATELVATAFLSNMSSRASKVLQDDIASLPSMPRTDVEEAQSELIKLAKGLIDRGEIANPKRQTSEDSSYDLG